MHCNRAGRATNCASKPSNPSLASSKRPWASGAFSLRAQIKVARQGTLVCLSYNLRRLHRVMADSQRLQPVL